MKKIISVSRRTDVAAFYSEWFMNRVRDGYVRWVNPFSRLAHRISLRPEDVIAFVLWSKNYAPLLPHLDELDARGYPHAGHPGSQGISDVAKQEETEANGMRQVHPCQEWTIQSLMAPRMRMLYCKQSDDPGTCRAGPNARSVVGK